MKMTLNDTITKANIHRYSIISYTHTRVHIGVYYQTLTYQSSVYSYSPMCWYTLISAIYLNSHCDTCTLICKYMPNSNLKSYTVLAGWVTICTPPHGPKQFTIFVDSRNARQCDTTDNKSDVRRRNTLGYLEQYMCKGLRLWNSRAVRRPWYITTRRGWKFWNSRDREAI